MIPIVKVLNAIFMNISERSLVDGVLKVKTFWITY